jgi:SAM-dependent methyltransferase
MAAQPGSTGYALVLASPRVLVARSTLEALRARVDAGAPAAAPHRLAEVGGADGATVYTLRGFERAERAVLASPPRTAPATAPAAALLAADTWRRLGGAGPGELLAAVAGPDLVRAGLCHEFIDYYGEVRSDVVALLPEGVREVLEIGCGRGATGRHLQQRLGCRVTGVELNPQVARAAAGVLHRVVAGDVEDPAVLAGLDGGYDAVVALELFEHLVEPEAFLERALELVRPGGRIVLSVPNVGHWSVVEDLLAGRWDYLPVGLLCYTHYRFFTRRTLEDWLGRCGVSRFRLVPQTTEPAPWIGAAAALAGAALELDEESLSTQGFYVVVDR